MSAQQQDGAATRLLDKITTNRSEATAIAGQYGLSMRRLDDAAWHDAASRFVAWAEACEAAGGAPSEHWRAILTMAAGNRAALLAMVDELYPAPMRSADIFGAVEEPSPGQLPGAMPATMAEASTTMQAFAEWLKTQPVDAWRDGALALHDWGLDCVEGGVLLEGDLRHAMVWAASGEHNNLALVHDLFPAQAPAMRGDVAELRVIDGGRGAPVAAPQPSLDRFRPFFDGEGNSEPPPTLIKRTLRKRGVVVIGGPSQAGKSYIAVLLAACLASGKPFFGLPVQETVGVIYAAAEGDDTIQPRLRAVKPGLGLGMSQSLPICVLQSFRMPRRGDGKSDAFAPFVADVKAAHAAFEARHLPPPGVLVIDTASAGIDMEDENSSNSIADVIDRSRALGEETDMLVIIVHHYGKDPTKKGRGSNVWFANPDQVLSVHAKFDKNQVPTNERSLFLDKLRGTPPRLIANFKLEQVAIGVDSDGDELVEAFATTRDSGETVTAADMLPPRPQHAEKKQGPRDIAFDQAFAWAEKGHATPRRVRHDGPLVNMVPLKHVRDQFSIAYATGEDGKERRAGAIRKAFLDVLKVVRKDPRYAFEASGAIEWVWLASSKAEQSCDAKHTEFSEDFEENQIPI
jgi:hypothetical protein